MNTADFSKPAVIFGAGSGGRKVAKILLDLGFSVKAFIDNDKTKWGSSWEGILISSPKLLKELECNILVASTFETEVKKQLEDMGVAHETVLKEDYIMAYAKSHMDEIARLENPTVKDKGTTVLLSSETGFLYWGVEQYCRTVGGLMKQYNIPFRILAKEGRLHADEALRYNISFFQFEMDHYWAVVKEEASYIIRSLPCAVMDNWQSYTLIAALLVKRLYPEQITILSMLHNDQKKLKEIVSRFQDELDYIGAVSKDIVSSLREEYQIPQQKLVYQESPVLFPSLPVQNRYYTLDSKKPLRIAYGSRLTRVQKRSHMLLPMLDLLETSGAAYTLSIAGAGECLEYLQEGVALRNLKEKVIFHGLLPNSQMGSFWKAHDIFLNLSDFEGASISMIEAMSYGCVPVVTDVSGAKEYVAKTGAGFVRDVDDLKGMAEDILTLSGNRKLLKYYGKNAVDTITSKCGGEKYIAFLQGIFGL